MPKRRFVKRNLGEKWNQLHIIGKIITLTIVTLLVSGFITMLLGI